MTRCTITTSSVLTDQNLQVRRSTNFNSSSTFNRQILQASNSWAGLPQPQTHLGVHWRHHGRTRRSWRPWLSRSQCLSVGSRIIDHHRFLRSSLHVQSGLSGFLSVHTTIRISDQLRSVKVIVTILYAHHKPILSGLWTLVAFNFSLWKMNDKNLCEFGSWKFYGETQ